MLSLESPPPWPHSEVNLTAVSARSVTPNAGAARATRVCLCVKCAERVAVGFLLSLTSHLHVKRVGEILQ